MYAQGVDFSQETNRKIALRLLDTRDGKTLIVFTKIRHVTAADCGAAPGPQCVNTGYPAIVQRIVIGDSDLHPSTFGTPLSVDPATGRVLNWATDASARVTDSGVSVKPGEFAYAAETYIAGPDDHTGVYARTLF